MATIKIDGIDFTNCSSIATDNFKNTISLNASDTSFQINASNEIQVIKEGFEYLASKYFVECSKGIICEVEIKIESGCCRTYLFSIEADGITYDPCNGVISFVLINRSQEHECYKYLNTTYYYENGFKEAYTHPKVPFCWEFTIISYVVLAIYAALKPILGLLNFAALLGNNWQSRFENSILNCGRYHIGIRLLDVLEYHTNKCGLTLVSDSYMYKIPYMYSVILFGSTNNGFTINDVEDWNEGSQRDLTMTEILDLAADSHNLKWVVYKGQLILERADYFDQITSQLLDIDEEYRNGASKAAPLYTYNQVDQCTSLKYAYRVDPLDAEGAKVASLYNGRKKYVEEGNFLKEVCQPIVGFSPARGLNSINRDFNLNSTRMSHGGFLGSIFGWGTQDFIHELSLGNGGMLANPKILIMPPELEQETGAINGSYMIRRQLTEEPFLYDYNYPEYFSPDYPEVELWQCFFYVNNPNLSNNCFDVADYELFISDCSKIDQIVDDYLNQVINTKFGLAKFRSVEIEHTTEGVKLKFNGIKIL